jgi:uncharacterized membrane-anchored protein
MDFQQHPLRSRVLAELHARPFAPLSPPTRILHFAFLNEGDNASAAAEALDRFCASLGEQGPAPGAKHHRLSLSGVRLRFEMHSEFSTFTWEEAAPPGVPFATPPDRLMAYMRKVAPPGLLIVAVDLVLAEESDRNAAAEGVFAADSLAYSSAEHGAARVASDFKADPLGLVRILVVSRSLTETQAGALAQRLLEIETYRTLALLGQPEAQALAPIIRRIETELPGILDEMRGRDDFDDNHRALDRLTALAAELEHGAAASLYRFGATRAYHELVQLRMEAIGEEPIAGHVGWSSFLARRLSPAIRTCVTTQERQDNLSRKLSRAAQLLRTRVDVDLERQNRDQLQVMNDRLHLQLRLQQTVEGLSIAAITYYVVNLIHLMLDGAHQAGLPVNPNAGTAIALPVTLLAVAWLVRRIRKRHAA